MKELEKKDFRKILIIFGIAILQTMGFWNFWKLKYLAQHALNPLPPRFGPKLSHYQGKVVSVLGDLKKNGNLNIKT